MQDVSIIPTAAFQNSIDFRPDPFKPVLSNQSENCRDRTFELETFVKGKQRRARSSSSSRDILLRDIMTMWYTSRTSNLSTCSPTGCGDTAFNIFSAIFKFCFGHRNIAPGISYRATLCVDGGIVVTDVFWSPISEVVAQQIVSNCSPYVHRKSVLPTNSSVRSFLGIHESFVIL